MNIIVIIVALVAVGCGPSTPAEIGAAVRRCEREGLVGHVLYFGDHADVRCGGR